MAFKTTRKGQYLSVEENGDVTCKYVYICMHICMYAFMYVYICMYVCMYACMYAGWLGYGDGLQDHEKRAVLIS